MLGAGLLVVVTKISDGAQEAVQLALASSLLVDRLLLFFDAVELAHDLQRAFALLEGCVCDSLRYLAEASEWLDRRWNTGVWKEWWDRP